MNTNDFKLLQAISLPSYDNGEYITDPTRLNKIKELIKDSAYQYGVEDPLFYLVSKKPLKELPDSLIVISTHIDAVSEITKFFAREIDSDTLLGTFDNTATNAAALSLLLENALPDKVVIAFTANEESESKGARSLADYLKSTRKKAVAIVLDVTNEGYKKAHFTLENNFYSSKVLHDIVKTTLTEIEIPFRFIPENAMTIPDYIKFSYLELHSDGGIVESLPDESWDYYEKGVECFSLCLPICGEMHDNRGIECLKESFSLYKEAVKTFANKLSLIL